MVIRQHGNDAEIVAAQRADQMLERGDRKGQLVWMRIRRAIAELQAAVSGRRRAYSEAGRYRLLACGLCKLVSIV
jgi:hypothetical protein